MTDTTTSALRCPTCGGTMRLPTIDAVRCESCSATWPRRGDIIDFLERMTHDVEHELVGLAVENQIDPDDDFANVKVMAVESIESIAELMDKSRDDGQDYYQHTTAAYLEGLSRIKPDSGMKVLEIGAERTFYNLRMLRDIASEAYALNIFFVVTPETRHVDWPVRVLGDMNRLPFADGYFDLVIASATMHHTPDPALALRELARVLRPGGRALVVNEPVEGWVKSWGRRRGTPRHDRDEHIHEEPVAMATWRSGIRSSNLVPEYFVPAWFLQKVAAADTANRRFGRAAGFLTPLLRSAAARDAVRLVGRVPAQYFLGLPLNVVLTKPK